jgi:uncharacterized membrane-anchored protein YitT (DUF2179 family)
MPEMQILNRTQKFVLSNVRWRIALKEGLYLTLGALLLAVGFNIFLAPSKMAPGGVSGISLIINKFAQLPLGMTMLLVSIPILILGFFQMGRFRFLMKVGYVTLLYTMSVDLLAGWLPSGGITEDLLLNALYGGVVGGVGSGLLYRGQSSAAGTGVISRILQLKTGIPISQLYILIDGVVILGLGLNFGWDKALYALLMLFVWGMTADYILEGPSVVRTVFIITDSPQQVSQALLERLGLGVTAWNGKGMFTGQERAVLFCSINRPDVNNLKRTVSQVDPQAFVVIGQGHQTSGGVVRHKSDREKMSFDDNEGKKS